MGLSLKGICPPQDQPAIQQEGEESKTNLFMEANKAQSAFQSEEKKQWFVVPVSHGDTAYASWDYQKWLESKYQSLTQDLESVRKELASIQTRFEIERDVKSQIREALNTPDLKDVVFHAKDLMAELSQLKQSQGAAIEIVSRLAAWSRKYSRSQIFSMNRKEEIDGQLIRIEEDAITFINALPSPPSKETKQ